jgi:hypothetical protein
MSSLFLDVRKKAKIITHNERKKKKRGTFVQNVLDGLAEV